MILTIDAGNTRTKWAVFNADNAVQASGVLDHANLSAPPALWATCRMAVIANVAGDAVADRLKAMLGNIPKHWVAAETAAYGIHNCYAQPQLLGADRWAALVGARQYMQQSCLVVSAGTALTVDVLLSEDAQDGWTFAGGIIVAGRHLQMQALQHGTYGITPAIGSDSNTPAGHIDWPTTTTDAIAVGSIMAMAGAVEQMATALQIQIESPVHCIVCGGDAMLLAERLRGSSVISDIVVIEDLVLRGLLVIGREIS